MTSRLEQVPWIENIVSLEVLKDNPKVAAGLRNFHELVLHADEARELHEVDEDGLKDIEQLLRGTWIGSIYLDRLNTEHQSQPPHVFDPKRLDFVRSRNT